MYQTWQHMHLQMVASDPETHERGEAGTPLSRAGGLPAKAKEQGGLGTAEAMHRAANTDKMAEASGPATPERGHAPRLLHRPQPQALA